jgi:hypothetical protein
VLRSWVFAARVPPDVERGSRRRQLHAGARAAGALLLNAAPILGLGVADDHNPDVRLAEGIKQRECRTDVLSPVGLFNCPVDQLGLELAEHIG